MTLREYLASNSLSLAEFGQRIGVKAQSVHRYVQYGRVPESAVMAKISAATGGDVTPNDFFEMPIAQTIEAAE